MNCVKLLTSFHRQCFYKISTRCFHHPVKFLEAQERWREHDEIPTIYQLIYKAPMDNLLKYASAYLTFSTATVGLGSVYYAAFVFDPAEMNDPIMAGDVVLASNATECFTYLIAFIGFHAAVKVVLSKYVLRLYQNGDDYIAVFRGHLYNSLVKHEFHLDEFKKLKPTIFNAWGDARFSMGTKHAILLENYFKTPEHFNYLVSKNKARVSDSEQDND